MQLIRPATNAGGKFHLVWILGQNLFSSFHIFTWISCVDLISKIINLSDMYFFLLLRRRLPVRCRCTRGELISPNQLCATFSWPSQRIWPWKKLDVQTTRNCMCLLHKRLHNSSVRSWGLRISASPSSDVFSCPICLLQSTSHKQQTKTFPRNCGENETKDAMHVCHRTALWSWFSSSVSTWLWCIWKPSLSHGSAL